MRNSVSIFVKTVLIAWTIAGCDEVELGMTYVRDVIDKYVHSVRLEDLDEKSIPQVPVEYAGEIGLELRRTVKLVFNEKASAIGTVGWMRIPYSLPTKSRARRTSSVSTMAATFDPSDGEAKDLESTEALKR